MHPFFNTASLWQGALLLPALKLTCLLSTKERKKIEETKASRPQCTSLRSHAIGEGGDMKGGGGDINVMDNLFPCQVRISEPLNLKYLFV